MVVSVISGFIAAASLLIGAVASFYGAHSGGHHRDKDVTWEYPTGSSPFSTGTGVSGAADLKNKPKLTECRRDARKKGLAGDDRWFAIGDCMEKS